MIFKKLSKIIKEAVCIDEMRFDKVAENPALSLSISNSKYDSFQKLFHDIEWTKNPKSISEVKKIRLNYDQSVFVKNLQMFELKKIVDNSDLTKFFTKTMPNFFIVKDGDDKMLVDTQGFNYVRFAIKF